MDVLKPVLWVGRTLKDLRGTPQEVRSVVGHALDLAQRGDKHRDAKPLQGFGGARVLETVDNDHRTYRAVYTIKYERVVFVLHVFQKKSTRGIKTNKSDLDLIKKRLQDAEDIFESGVVGLKERERQRKGKTP